MKRFGLLPPSTLPTMPIKSFSKRLRGSKSSIGLCEVTDDYILGDKSALRFDIMARLRGRAVRY
jgi:hypothetical protein